MKKYQRFILWQILMLFTFSLSTIGENKSDLTDFQLYLILILISFVIASIGFYVTEFEQKARNKSFLLELKKAFPGSSILSNKSIILIENALFEVTLISNYGHTKLIVVYKGNEEEKIRLLKFRYKYSRDEDTGFHVFRNNSTMSSADEVKDYLYKYGDGVFS